VDGQNWSRGWKGGEISMFFQFREDMLCILSAGENAIVQHTSVCAHVGFYYQRVGAVPIPAQKA